MKGQGEGEVPGGANIKISKIFDANIKISEFFGLDIIIDVNIKI